MATIVKRGKKYSVVYNYTDENGVSRQKWEPSVPTMKVKDFLDEFVEMYGLRKWGLGSN